MAQDLPFSIDNILRADFPHPSRISKLPRVLHTMPALRGREKPPFVALRCQLNCRMNPAATRHPAGENYSSEIPAVAVYPEDNAPAKTEQGVADEDSSEGKTVIGSAVYCLLSISVHFYLSLFLELSFNNADRAQLKNVYKVI